MVTGSHPDSRGRSGRRELRRIHLGFHSLIELCHKHTHTHTNVIMHPPTSMFGLIVLALCSAIGPLIGIFTILSARTRGNGEPPGI